MISRFEVLHFVIFELGKGLRVLFKHNFKKYQIGQSYAFLEFRGRVNLHKIEKIKTLKFQL